MSTIASMAFLLVVLTGTFFLTAATSAFRRIRRHRSRYELNQLAETFVYSRLLNLLFPRSQFNSLLFALYSAQNITRFLTGVTVVIILLQLQIIPGEPLQTAISLLTSLGFSLFLGDFLPRTWAARNPSKCMSDCSPVASIYLLFAFPLSYPFLWWHQIRASSRELDPQNESIAQVKEKIIEMIEGVATLSHLDASDKKLIESAITFRDRVVREVMVPRVDIFALPSTTTVRQAAKLLDQEGYSRAPVYKESVDNIIGVLMYKDLMNLFLEADETPTESSPLDLPIEDLIIDALYTPETKKVSDLLQEFKKKQTHIAVVVDEYGGTEGIVTIEDLLEEIVGEIEDEYDEEESLYLSGANGSWVVDARMSILDLEEELGFKIPQDGDYDTIGGYVFHRAGTIPDKGLVIHSDDFEMEILSSTDRTVKKVRITDLTIDKPEEDEQRSASD